MVATGTSRSSVTAKKASRTPNATTALSLSPVTAELVERDSRTPMVATAKSPSPVTRNTVERAVKALLKWRGKKSESEKPQLLEQDEFLYLILTLKKIPTGNQTKPIKIPLPRPLYDPANDGSELCLIVDDRPKSRLTKDSVKLKVEQEKIPVSKILKLSKLKSDYRPFEAKRKLCDSYDLFLADRRVIPLLPKMLGKQFFRKRKIPMAVDLEHQNWKEQVERACGSAMLYLRTGTCCVLKVGRVSMGAEELVENVVAAIHGAGEAVPRKWGNMRSLHLKLLESLALPVYQKLPDVKLKIETCKEEEVGEGKNVAKVDKVEMKKKKKGRISNVMYIEDQIAGLVDGEDSDLDIGDCNVVGGKRKKLGEEKDAKEAKKVKKGGEEKDAKAAKKVKKGGEEKDAKAAKKVKKGGEEKDAKAAKKVKKADAVKA